MQPSSAERSSPNQQTSSNRSQNEGRRAPSQRDAGDFSQKISNNRSDNSTDRASNSNREPLGFSKSMSKNGADRVSNSNRESFASPNNGDNTLSSNKRDPLGFSNTMSNGLSDHATNGFTPNLATSANKERDPLGFSSTMSNRLSDNTTDGITTNNNLDPSATSSNNEAELNQKTIDDANTEKKEIATQTENADIEKQQVNSQVQDKAALNKADESSKTQDMLLQRNKRSLTDPSARSNSARETNNGNLATAEAGNNTATLAQRDAQAGQHTAAALNTPSIQSINGETTAQQSEALALNRSAPALLDTRSAFNSPAFLNEDPAQSANIRISGDALASASYQIQVPTTDTNGDRVFGDLQANQDGSYTIPYNDQGKGNFLVNSFGQRDDFLVTLDRNQLTASAEGYGASNFGVYNDAPKLNTKVNSSAAGHQWSFDADFSDQTINHFKEVSGGNFFNSIHEGNIDDSNKVEGLLRDGELSKTPNAIHNLLGNLRYQQDQSLQTLQANTESYSDYLIERTKNPRTVTSESNTPAEIDKEFNRVMEKLAIDGRSIRAKQGAFLDNVARAQQMGIPQEQILEKINQGIKETGHVSQPFSSIEEAGDFFIQQTNKFYDDSSAVISDLYSQQANASDRAHQDQTLAIVNTTLGAIGGLSFGLGAIPGLFNSAKKVNTLVAQKKSALDTIALGSGRHIGGVFNNPTLVKEGQEALNQAQQKLPKAIKTLIGATVNQIGSAAYLGGVPPTVISHYPYTSRVTSSETPSFEHSEGLPSFGNNISTSEQNFYNNLKDYYFDRLPAKVTPENLESPVFTQYFQGNAYYHEEFRTEQPSNEFNQKTRELEGAANGLNKDAISQGADHRYIAVSERHGANHLYGYGAHTTYIMKVPNSQLWLKPDGFPVETLIGDNTTIFSNKGFERPDYPKPQEAAWYKPWPSFFDDKIEEIKFVTSSGSRLDN